MQRNRSEKANKSRLQQTPQCAPQSCITIVWLLLPESKKLKPPTFPSSLCSWSRGAVTWPEIDRTTESTCCVLKMHGPDNISRNKFKIKAYIISNFLTFIRRGNSIFNLPHLSVFFTRHFISATNKSHEMWQYDQDLKQQAVQLIDMQQLLNRIQTSFMWGKKAYLLYFYFFLLWGLSCSCVLNTD